MKVEFEDLAYPRPEFGNYTLYHYGNLIDDEGNEFSFTLTEMYDGSTDYAVHELTWVEDTPKNDNIDLKLKIESALEDCYEDMEQEAVIAFKEEQRKEDEKAYHGLKDNFNQRSKEI